jgi:hypothetical protein
LAEDPRAFRPLDKIFVTVPASRTKDFLNEITNFAGKEKIEFKTGPFPKGGRIVKGFALNVTPSSFFLGGSFSNPEQYIIIAYSHEDPKTWRQSWDRLKALLGSTFGPLDNEER